MRISELITKLQEIEKEHGDLTVLSQEDGFGGYSMNTLSEKVSIETISLSSLLYSEEGVDEEVGKQLFPEWDGDPDSDQDLALNCLVLNTGYFLYAT